MLGVSQIVNVCTQVSFIKTHCGRFLFIPLYFLLYYTAALCSSCLLYFSVVDFLGLSIYRVIQLFFYILHFVPSLKYGGVHRASARDHRS